MTARERPEQRSTFVLTLRAEPHVADTIKALRRGLKYLLRACGLRAIGAVELHPDPPDDPTRTGRPCFKPRRDTL
jgi:hypothetical protein